MSELRKFLFEGLPVRGMLVRLTESWQDLLKRRGQAESGAYPEPVRGLLGEMAAAGVLMQSNIKFNGALILQMQGDGPVRLAVAEVQPDLSFRATATVQGPVSEGARLEALLNVHGKGRCAITLDPKDRLPGQQPYQGVVPLHGDQREPLQNLSEVLEHYMLQSEQLDTRLVLAANDHVAAGLLIQRLPVGGEGNLGGPNWKRDEDAIGQSEDFNRLAHLAATLTKKELLGLDAETICAACSGKKMCATSNRCGPGLPAVVRASGCSACSAAWGPRKAAASWKNVARWTSGVSSAAPTTPSMP